MSGDVGRRAWEHDALYFGANPLRLMPFVKEHYFRFLSQSFPHLLPRYERAYRGTNAPNAYQHALRQRLDEVRVRYGFTDHAFHEPEPSAPPSHANEQLALL